MRTRTAHWFETRIRYDKVMEDGKQKKVTEQYVVDALSFGEAEEAIAKEMRTYISGEFEVKAITPTAHGEIFFSDNATDDRWYKAKLSFITKGEALQRQLPCPGGFRPVGGKECGGGDGHHDDRLCHCIHHGDKDYGRV